MTVVPSKTAEPVVGAAAAALPSVVNIDVTGALDRDDLEPTCRRVTPTFP